MVALLVLLTIMVFLTVDYFVQRRRGEAVAGIKEAVINKILPFETASYRTPAGVYFDHRHTWVFLEESGTAKLGIDEFAQSLVGRIDRVDTRSVGEKVREGDVILRLHHGDRVAEFRAPVDGVIDEVNTKLLSRPDLTGVEPFTAGWFYRVTPGDTSTLPRSMQLGTTAKAWLNREIQRLKVFLATITPQHAVLGETLQDGGLPSTDLIDELDETNWNKLREKFFGQLDTSG